MRTILVVLVLALVSQHATAAAVDSVGVSVSPLTLYSRSSLRDSSFPTTLHVLGATNRLRLEYSEYNNDLPSDVQTRQYNNSALMVYYNKEFLLRARRGSILGRTRMFLAGGAGLFRSRLNDAVNAKENNIGYGAIAGFRYFVNKNFYIGGEGKYLYSVIAYSDPQYESQNIGGLFFGLSAGFRFSE